MCNKISVFTPTYNRAFILESLYKSLVNQKYSDFNWIIVDDGSTDNTQHLVDKWINEKRVKIIYKKQNNQGKHVAINRGVNLCDSELFFIVDSDDFISEDSLEKIVTFWDGNKNGDLISGIIALKKYYKKNKIVGTELPKGLLTATLTELYEKYNVTGDKVVIYRTDILKKFPFPTFKGELFLLESIVFKKIDCVYKMLLLNEPIYFCEYLEDGLSQDFRKLYRENPRGFLESFNMNLEESNILKNKIKSAAHLINLSLYLKDFKYVKKFSSKWFMIPAFPLALYLYIKIFIFKVSDVKSFNRQ
ncbi:glycosyltransferase family 2 protein [Clostridium estertheticum]|uniref:Glycosyltransferase family 2 protein n=1 Tax=Clostridium estertheticum TaxID=238834 RepID=A0A7Y3SYD4_9CLOT|nr:glycosyltransferase family 2 protein [Clostridium estertheticum]NNU77313.1 glycosyltransferase family 2 protein [Clostridium estertheticum]WBL47049.1 glycosyltransferase family 2 protein [Clostridium estertheticum]